MNDSLQMNAVVIELISCFTSPSQFNSTTWEASGSATYNFLLNIATLDTLWNLWSIYSSLMVKIKTVHMKDNILPFKTVIVIQKFNRNWVTVYQHE